MKVLTQEEVNTLYEMFSNLVNILNKNAVKWTCTDGTLLGAVRHGGLIPWDDDCDIAIDKKDVPLLFWLRSQVECNGFYKLVRVGKYIKLKKDKLWIDIFVLDDWKFPQRHFKNLSFIDDELFPLRQAKFGDIVVNIPHKSEEYLSRILPGWDTTAIIYNHKVKKKTSYELTPELKLPYLPN